MTREIFAETRRKFSENELPSRAAAVAYYALTCLVPFLAVVLTLVARLIPDVTAGAGERNALSGMTVEEFRSLMGSVLPAEAYEVVGGEIARIQQQPPVGLLSISLVMSLWLASGLFGTVIDALNRIHRVKETRPYWKVALVAIAVTALQAVILIGGLTTLVLVPLIKDWLGWRLQSDWIFYLVEWLIMGAAVSISYAMVSYFGPNVHRPWRWVSTGSLIGSPAFLIAAAVLRLYARHFGNYGKTYGSLAGVMLLALWFWVSALTMLAAVQIDQVIDTKRKGEGDEQRD